MKPIIETAAVEGRHIVKNFRLGDTVTEVLRDVSLRVMPGEFVSIMGPSGSGKSTLLYILGGLDTPTGGRVLLNGTDISSFGDEKMSGLRRRSIGFVFQFYNLIPNLNVEENIMLPLLLDGQKMERCKDRLDRILDMVGLTGADTRPGSYPAASSSVWQSPARSSAIPEFSSPTSPPVISTRKPAPIS